MSDARCDNIDHACIWHHARQGKLEALDPLPLRSQIQRSCPGLGLGCRICTMLNEEVCEAHISHPRSVHHCRSRACRPKLQDVIRPYQQASCEFQVRGFNLPQHAFICPMKRLWQIVQGMPNAPWEAARRVVELTIYPSEPTIKLKV
jgi:hypothetical protein